MLPYRLKYRIYERRRWYGVMRLLEIIRTLPDEQRSKVKFYQWGRVNYMERFGNATK